MTRLGHRARRALRKALRFARRRPPPSTSHLEGLMRRYRVADLVNVDEAAFKARIDDFLALDDPSMEGLADAAGQRDLTVRFHWGHDHDFGSFRLAGRMGCRHIRHLAEFIDTFGAIPRSLEGLRALDIGCWTGGASLLLCAMGAEVVAVDEVKKYTDCLAYLKHAFALDNLEVRHGSLYELTAPELQDRFDLVLFAGVLYHVTDPIVALRITFNCLRDGGRCLLETTGFDCRRPLISYQRRRWNWFDLSPPALSRMMADVGYRQVRVGRVTHDDRLYAVARRESHVDMRRDGLSVSGLR